MVTKPQSEACFSFSEEAATLARVRAYLWQLGQRSFMDGDLVDGQRLLKLFL